MSNLRQRVLTGLILVPLVVGATLLLSTERFSLVIAGLAVLGAWEWAALCGWRAPGARLTYCAAFIAVLVLVEHIAGKRLGLAVVLGSGLVWWLFATAWVVRLQQGAPVEALESAPVRLVGGLLTLVPAWAALAHLHGVAGSGPVLVLFLMVLVWTADIAAYFSGRRFGKHRLASRVSPGKSVEGVLGALAAGALLAAAAGGLVGVRSTAALVAFSLATVLVSVLGDLSESVFKRRAGVKDSGTLVPGHGGVLDRIDSLTAAAPVFALGQLWQGA